MVKLPMDLNSNNLSGTVIPACFWLESSDLRRWMPASAGTTNLFRTTMRESGTKSAEADLHSLWLARRAKYMDVFRNPANERGQVFHRA